MLSRFEGCLVGVAVGDALGAPVEGMSREQIQQEHGVLREMVGGGWLNLSPGQGTDDTALMLCVARSIVNVGHFDPKDVGYRFVRWLASRPKDVGNVTWQALEELRAGVPWYEAGERAHHKLLGQSNSSGCLMRCAPIGLLDFRRPAQLVEDSLNSSRITHWHERACWSTVALNQAIAELVQGKRDDLLHVVSQKIEDPDVRLAVVDVADLDEEGLEPSGSAVNTLQAALWCFCNTSSFEDALVRAINLGRDADTVGAVCGALAGAYYGLQAIPSRWRVRLWDGEEIEALVTRIYRLSRAPSS